ncbi:histidine phosphatase family protein [Tessaracoccus sp.]
MTTHVVFLRHGQTDWNHTHRLQGQADVHLDALGVQQAHAAANALKTRNFSAVYSSDLERAAVTARTVAADLDLPVRVDPRLQEIHVGSWSGKTRDQVELEMPEYAAWYLQGKDFRRSESGETMEEMLLRSAPAIEEILERHQGQEVLVVGHGFLISKLLQHLLELPNDSRVIGALGNAHWSEVAFSDHGASLVSHNVSPVPGDWSSRPAVR